MDPIKPSPRTRKVDRAAVAEVFILHLPCSHDIIDIEKEATVDGCPLVSQEMTAQFVRLGRSFFYAFIFAEGVSQGKASNCEADDFNDSAVHIRIKHANPLLPVEICRRATVTVEGVPKPLHPSNETSDAEGNRLPLVAIGSRDAPDIFIISYSCWRGEGNASW